MTSPGPRCRLTAPPADMGIPKHPPTVMRWQSTLYWMKQEGTRLMRTCSSPCKYWIMEDLDAMIALLGPDASLHGERPPCPRCRRLNIFMASPAEGTPFRPLHVYPREPDPPRPPGGWPPWPGPRQTAKSPASS